MTSILKVDTIQDTAGNNIINESSDTITIGASGDTITIPSGATIDLSSATQTGVGGTNTPAFSAYSNSGQTLSDNIDTKVDFDTEDFDTDGAYDTTNKRFTVPSGEGGKYFFYTRVRFQQSSLSQYVIAFRVNGNEVAQRYLYSGNVSNGIFSNAEYFAYDISAVETLSVGDYVEVYVKADSTGGSTTPLNSGTVIIMNLQDLKL
jgi:hypothetical protein